MPRSRLLNNLERNLRNPFNKRTANALDEVFADRMIEIFAAEAAPDRTPWKPLSPSYLKVKQGPQILIETGNLFASLVDPNHPEHIQDRGKRTLKIGTSVPYASKNNEERPFVDEDPVLAKRLAQKLAEELVNRS